MVIYLTYSVYFLHWSNCETNKMNLSTLQIPHISQINMVIYLTHSVWFLHWYNCEITQMNFSEIANTVCLLKLLLNNRMYPQSTHIIRYEIVSALCNIKIVKQPKWIFLKYLTQYVGLSQSMKTKCFPNQHGNLSNI